MKISTKGRYALRFLLDLAEHQSDGFIALKDVAKRQNISKKYLEQIIPILNKSDVLNANRGYQGGYQNQGGYGYQNQGYANQSAPAAYSNAGYAPMPTMASPAITPAIDATSSVYDEDIPF